MPSGSWQAIANEPGVWTTSYRYGRGGRANAVAVGLGDRRLLVLSPPTDAEAIAALREHGEVVALVAPNGFHHLGLRAWQEAFPDARTFAPEVGARRIRKKNPALREIEPLTALAEILPESVWVGEPPGMRHGDAVLRVDTEHGALWGFNDVVANQPSLDRLPLPVRIVFKLTKSGPGFRVMRVVLPLLVRDKRRYRDWLLAELERHPPRRVVVGHGVAVLDEVTAAELPEMLRAAL